VSISAGQDISDLSVSLPTTWQLNSVRGVTTIGGGNLSVRAGKDILNGAYFVANGKGAITAGGQIGADFTYQAQPYGAYQPFSAPVGTFLALQDATLTVNARGAVNIAGVYNPSYLIDRTIAVWYGLNNRYGGIDNQSYSANSSVSIASVSGDVGLSSFSQAGLGSLFAYGLRNTGTTMFGTILPATVDVTALQGGISVESAGELYPSSTGDLRLIAADSIDLYNLNAPPTSATERLLSPIRVRLSGHQYPVPGEPWLQREQSRRRLQRRQQPRGDRKSRHARLDDPDPAGRQHLDPRAWWQHSGGRRFRAARDSPSRSAGHPDAAFAFQVICGIAKLVYALGRPELIPASLWSSNVRPAILPASNV
jgi:hypothetical protein